MMYAHRFSSHADKDVGCQVRGLVSGLSVLHHACVSDDVAPSQGSVQLHAS